MNGKDAFYFPHDSNALSDPKCQALVSVFGMEGYGRFWSLIEMMRDSAGYCIEDKPYVYDALAMRWQCESEAAHTFIDALADRFGLIVRNDGHLLSTSLVSRMAYLDGKRKTNAQNARKGWEKRKSDATAMQPQCDGNATAMQREEKIGEETKGNTIPAKQASPIANFSEFWTAYPNKKGKADAEKWWKRNKPTPELLDTMLQAIAAQKTERILKHGRGVFCPEWKHGSTWLNARAWEDEVATVEQINGMKPIQSEKPNVKTSYFQ